jgi:hypothetical protein
MPTVDKFYYYCMYMMLILMICASGLVKVCTISSNKQGWIMAKLVKRRYPKLEIEFSSSGRQIAKEIDRQSKARPFL